jgi:hypothetical protein
MQPKINTLQASVCFRNRIKIIDEIAEIKNQIKGLNKKSIKDLKAYYFG